MAYNAEKTDHSGPKKGQGAYYGRKAIAKKESSHQRRQNGRKEAAANLTESGNAKDGVP
ncbi:MAG: hypothetical protein WCO23_01355 [bacterium]